MTQTETQQETPPVEEQQAPVEQASDFQALIAKARADKPQRMTPTDLELAKRMTLMYGRGPKKRWPYDAEVEYYLHCIRKYNLDPMQRQICAVWRWDKNAGEPDKDGQVHGDEVMTVQTQIDGFRVLAARTGQYAGSDDPLFEYDDGGKIVKCTKTVWRIVKGVRCPFTATAYWKEYKPAAGFMWDRMEHCMISKCAEALALRTAFPADLGGLYVDAEMEQGNMTPPADAPMAAPDAPTAPRRADREQPAQTPPLTFGSVYGHWQGLVKARIAAGDTTWPNFDKDGKRRGGWFRTYLQSIVARDVPDPRELPVEDLQKLMADMEKNSDPRPFDQREQV